MFNLMQNYFLKNKTGAKLWKQAKQIIPGGNSILSKRPERYGKDIWPTYFEKSKDIYVWDLDGKKFIDMAQMGIGSSILGYNNKEVNEQVNIAINKGINTTLNCKEEVFLAQKLLKLNNFADSVKFARSGGEAMNVAIRIARAFSKKKKIAFSGYHGWFDWYLASNLKNKNNLNEHLLEGLLTNGVPNELKNTIFPFKYDDEKDLEKVINTNKEIGIIVVESARYNYPEKNFVKKINQLVKKRNLVLICDEITTGFRISNSGAYKKIGFKPDIVVYGKGLGNGFAISAVLGKKRIMSCAQDTFISSSNWSERVGFVAALKTLEIIERDKIWKKINTLGKIVAVNWRKIFLKYNLKIEVCNFYPLISMKLKYGKLNNYIITLFTQEMLKRGYLASTSIYLSSKHNNYVIKNYLKSCDIVFSYISKILKEKKIKNSLLTSVRTDAFQRLN
jgi:glutamate-1-semialdehyde aminotransferase